MAEFQPRIKIKGSGGGRGWIRINHNNTNATNNKKSKIIDRKHSNDQQLNAMSTRPKPKNKNKIPPKLSKSKKTQKVKKNRPKPSPQINLCDFINIAPKHKNYHNKRRKKLTFGEKLLKQETVFKIKEELKKHPYIIKQQKLKEKRIESKQSKSTSTSTFESKPKPKIKQLSPKKKKKSSSQKKQIKKGRIHSDVINIVEFLVNTVCDNDNNDNDDRNDKKTKNRKVRQRKKAMEKLKKFQSNVLLERNKFHELHNGSHGTIMKYSKIRSYSNHLISDELYDRIGFLLNKLSNVQQQRLQNNIKHKANKLFLCGIKECLKKLKNNHESIIGIILSSQIEFLPKLSGLDKQINEIKDLCFKYKIEIIYGLNRKQLNYILKLKPWQGNVSCVTILDINVYNDTWNRIIEIKRILNEQYLMFQHDYIPIYRASSLNLRCIPIYEQEIKKKIIKSPIINPIKKENKEENKEENIDKHIKEKDKDIKISTKLNAFAPIFEPVRVQNINLWQTFPFNNYNNYNNNNNNHNVQRINLSEMNTDL